MSFFRVLTVAFLMTTCLSPVLSQKIKLIQPLDIISQSDALYDSGKYVESVNILKTIPGRDTAYNQVQARIAYSLIGAQEFDEAIEICNQQLKNHSESHALFLRIRALATEKKGDYKGAVALFEQALKEYPTDVSLLFNLGLIQFNNKDYEKSEENFFRVLHFNPYHASSHANLAKIGIGQGRKVHAMLAMGMYLAINNKDNSNLVLINNFLDNQVSEEGTVPNFGANATERLDQMIRARIVNEPGYKSAFPITAAVVKQYELLFNQLKTIPESQDDKYVQFYLSVYQSIAKNNQVESFIYHILSSSSIEQVAKWNKSNEKKLNEFFSTANMALKQKRENVIVKEFGFKSPTNAWYNGQQLASIGNAVNDIRKGHWVFLHPNGEKSSEGNYNEQGVKIGTWKFYYQNRQVKSIENYDTGEVTVYSDTGKKTEHFFLKDDKIEGDIQTFYMGGPVHEKSWLVAGKRDGTKYLYYKDGTLNAKYEYKAGIANGAYLINYENGTLGERSFYLEDELHGKYENYHINGALSIAGEYAKGLQIGDWKYYYRNGKLSREGKYNVKGLPVGEWIYYDVPGEITEKRNFDAEGRFHGDNAFYSNGKIFGVSTYKKDILVKDTYYDQNGKVISTTGGGDGTYYSKNYFSTGQLRSEGNYKKGKATGEWKLYNRYGVLTGLYQYKDNALHGKIVDYFPTGEKQYEYEYKDGKLHGYYQEFYKNGKVKQEGWYQDGNREQQWLTYFQDGSLESDYYYIAGIQSGVGYDYGVDGKLYSEIEVDSEGITKFQLYDSRGAKSSMKRVQDFVIIHEEFFKNKKVKSRYDILAGSYVRNWERFLPDGALHYKYEMVNGKRNGVYISNEINGNVSTEGMFENDQREGIWKTYYDNGKTYSIGKYLNDQRDSLWTYYHDNGNISSQGWFKYDKRDGVTTFYGVDGTALYEKLFVGGDLIAYRSISNSQKGEWIKFSGTAKILFTYPNGNKASEEAYVNGLEQGFDRTYYPDGKLYKEFQYLNGDLSGEFKVYYPDGKLKEKGNYKDDELEGATESYDENGKLAQSISYKMGHRHGKAILYNKGVKQKELSFWYGIAEE
jgi:uncharacterized protein